MHGSVASASSLEVFKCLGRKTELHRDNVECKYQLNMHCHMPAPSRSVRRQCEPVGRCRSKELEAHKKALLPCQAGTPQPTPDPAPTDTSSCGSQESTGGCLPVCPRGETWALLCSSPSVLPMHSAEHPCWHGPLAWGREAVLPILCCAQDLRGPPSSPGAGRISPPASALPLPVCKGRNKDAPTCTCSANAWRVWTARAAALCLGCWGRRPGGRELSSLDSQGQTSALPAWDKASKAAFLARYAQAQVRCHGEGHRQCEKGAGPVSSMRMQRARKLFIWPSWAAPACFCMGPGGCIAPQTLPARGGSKEQEANSG